MKYMILTYASQQDYDAMSGKPNDRAVWSAADFAAMGAFMEQWNNELVASGEFVDARGLAEPVHTRRLGVRNGVPFVTDGPYAETQEVLAGYTIVDCVSFDRATEIAAGLVNPDGDGEYVDVRPILDGFQDLEA